MAKYELKLKTGVEKDATTGKETVLTETKKLDFISFRTSRKALEVTAEIEKLEQGESVDQLAIFDKQVEFIADVFGVSFDEILDGLDASTGITVIGELFNKILGYEEQQKKFMAMMETK